MRQQSIIFTYILHSQDFNNFIHYHLLFHTFILIVFVLLFLNDTSSSLCCRLPQQPLHHRIALLVGLCSGQMAGLALPLHCIGGGSDVSKGRHDRVNAAHRHTGAQLLSFLSSTITAIVVLLSITFRFIISICGILRAAAMFFIFRCGCCCGKDISERLLRVGLTRVDQEVHNRHHH